MKIVCTICARGGSKGVLNKNIRNINGKPLIYYTIRQALNTKLFDVVAVSSDSDEILQVALDSGANQIIKRPDELAQDTSPKLPVILHALRSVEEKNNFLADILVDLDCTSPLRNEDDIKNAINLLVETNAKNVITGSPARRSPYFNLVERNSDGDVILSKKLENQIARRQDAPKCFDMNASIYVWRRDGIVNSTSTIQDGTKIYIMPEERSLDIDSELDFTLVEFLMSKRIDLV